MGAAHAESRTDEERDGQTDRRMDGPDPGSRFLQLCERV